MMMSSIEREALLLPERATEDVPEPLQSSSFEISETEIEDEEERMLRENIPPLSSYIATWKFWYKFAWWPVVFFLANVVLFLSLLVFDEMQMRDYFRISKLSEKRMAEFITNTTVTAVVLLVDWLILWKAAIYLEKETLELRAMQENEQVSTNMIDRMSHVHAHVAQDLDKVFWKKRTTRSPVLVSLVYVLTILCGASFWSCLSLRMYASTGKMKRDCAAPKRQTREEKEPPKHIDGLPDELQDWAYGNRWSNSDRKNTFASLEDGRLFFAGTNAWTRNTANVYAGSSELLLMNVNGSLQAYPRIRYPFGFYPLGKLTNGKKQSESFCCGYNEAETNAGPYLDKTSIFCVSSGEDFVQNGLRNVSVVDRSNFSLHSFSMEAVKGNLFFRKMLRLRYREGTSSQRHTYSEVSKVIPTNNTLELLLLANITLEDKSRGTIVSGAGTGGACKRWLGVILFGTAAIALLPASIWLIKKKQLSAGISPVVILLWAVLGYLAGREFSMPIGFLAASVVSVCLFRGKMFRLSKCIHRESLLWFYYTVIVFFTLTTYFDLNGSLRDAKNMHQAGLPWWSFLLLCIVVGIVLNHPVLQVTGCGLCILPTFYYVLVGCASAIHGIYTSIFPKIPKISRSRVWSNDDGMMFDDDDLFLHDDPVYFSSRNSSKAFSSSIWVIPLGLVVGCGLVALGESVTKYRFCFIYYGKRLWRAVVSAAHGARQNNDVLARLSSQDATRRRLNEYTSQA